MTIVDSVEAFAIVCTAFVLGGLVKGLVGFGLPLVTIPLLSSIASIPEAVALNFLPVIFSNVVQITETRHAHTVLRRIWPLLATTTVLLFFGSVFLTTLDKRVLQAVIGAMIIGHVLFERRGLTLALTRAAERLLLLGAGVIAAVLGSVSSFAMFPSIQLLHSIRLKRDEFVLSVCVYLLLAYLALWSGLLRQGIPVIALLLDSLVCTVPLIGGTLLGGVLRNRVSQTKFRNWVKLALAATGVTLILRQLVPWLLASI